MPARTEIDRLTYIGGSTATHSHALVKSGQATDTQVTWQNDLRHLTRIDFCYNLCINCLFSISFCNVLTILWTNIQCWTMVWLLLCPKKFCKKTLYSVSRNKILPGEQSDVVIVFVVWCSLPSYLPVAVDVYITENSGGKQYTWNPKIQWRHLLADLTKHHLWLYLSKFINL